MDVMFQYELDPERPFSPELRQHFESNDISLSQQVQIEVQKPDQQWILHDLENQEVYFIRKSYDSEVSETTRSGDADRMDN